MLSRDHLEWLTVRCLVVIEELDLCKAGKYHEIDLQTFCEVTTILWAIEDGFAFDGRPNIPPSHAYYCWIRGLCWPEITLPEVQHARVVVQGARLVRPVLIPAQITEAQKTIRSFVGQCEKMKREPFVS